MHLRKRMVLSLYALGSVGILACGPSSGANGGPDSAFGECHAGSDADGDCIPDELEGCDSVPLADRDGDSLPDWFDADADNDGVPDNVEAGSCDAPRDTDGDGNPDFLDFDSDNDGVDDGDEDRNGDGAVGNCSTSCTSDAQCDSEASETCSLPLGGGAGVCVSSACLNGETNPLSVDTDNDGIDDGLEGTFICHEQSEDNPFGLKRIRYVDSADTVYPDADWRIAIEVGALDLIAGIDQPTALESVYFIDMTSPEVEVAGFLISRAATASSAAEESINAIESMTTPMAIGSSTVRVSGTNQTSLDGFETVLGTTLELTASGNTDVTAVREAIIPAMMNRDPATMSLGPVAWSGQQDQRFVVSYQTIYRAETQQTLYMGAVARLTDFDDRSKATGIHADDLSNGTGVSVSGNGEQTECEQYLAANQAVADIIWIIDESGSTSDDRTRISNNAQAFFSRAVDTGLDFRMGVTDMNDTGPGNEPGIFATRQTGGTGDRWLLPDEAAEFSAAIQDPSGPDAADGGSEHGLTQGRHAMSRHLPRNSADPQMVRDGAKIVVIYVTDERPDEIEDAGIFSFGDSQPDATQAQQIQAFIQEWIQDFIDNDAIPHLISEPLPFTQTPCSGGGAEHAYGYYELINALGGQAGSICQDNLGATLDAILDSVVGSASPMVLSKVPISASISVARDNQLVTRSRDTGWDFRGAANTVIFFNMPFDPANPSDVVVSYRRWEDQVPIN